jgi:hypothetical protein
MEWLHKLQLCTVVLSLRHRDSGIVGDLENSDVVEVSR